MTMKSVIELKAYMMSNAPIKREILTVVDLHREFTSKDVRFILVNCIASDKIDEMFWPSVSSVNGC